MRIRPLTHSAVLAATTLLLASPAARAATTFTLDPTRSSLTITNATFSESYSGTAVGSGTLTAQTAGSNTTTYSGTLSATLGAGASPASITFNSGAAAAKETGSYTPSTADLGGSGVQLADYGLTGTTTGAVATTVNAAIDAVILSLNSGAIPVTGGAFSLSTLTLPITGNYAYRTPTATAFGIIRGGGAFTNGNPVTPADATNLMGSYVVANGVATLTIPIDATYTATSSNLGNNGTATVVTEVVGTFTATAAVPEPGTWTLLAVTGTVVLTVRAWTRRRTAVAAPSARLA